MIEKDLAHLRFLSVRVQKGDHLTTDDLDFVQRKQDEVSQILNGIEEILDTVREKELML